MCFPASRNGAHRIDNRTDEPMRVVIVSTMLAPEVNEMFEEGAFDCATMPCRQSGEWATRGLGDFSG